MIHCVIKIGRMLGVAGLLLASLFSVHGQGSIVYVNPPDHQMLTTGGLTLLYDVDLDGNGTVDFTFRADRSFHIYSEIGNRSLGIPQGGLDFGSFSVPLSFGYVIGPETSDPIAWQSSFQPGFPPGEWIGQTLHSGSDLGTLGYWQPQMTAYLGVEFGIEGQTHYGWIQLTTPFFSGVNGGTILDWAYNANPGQPILAGQVPEPSTWALILGGALCMVFHRSRRPS